MKKTLVAVAALATISGAMAQATISGMVQVGTNKAVTTTSGATSSVNSIDDSNSNTGINIGVSEDLGDGMKFTGQIGIAVGIAGGNTTTLPGNGAQETFGAISGSFGSVKLGAIQSPQFLAIANGDAAGYLISNPVANIIQHQGGTVGSTALLQSNSLQYVLPTFVEGLSLKYQAALGEVSTGINGSNHYAANYAVGGLSAGYAYSTYKYTQTLTDSAQSVNLSYNFGPAKLTALWGSANTASASGVTGSSVGVVVPVGALSLMANYGSTNGLILNGVAGATARTVSTQKQSGTFAGASYSLSKRTTAYLAYYTESGNNGSSTAYAAGNNNKWTTTRFIVQHAF